MLKYIFYLLLPFITCSAFASGVAQFKGVDGGEKYTLKLEYLDSKTSRVDTDASSDATSYLIFAHGKATVVATYQGNTLVMDLNNMSSLVQNLGVMSVLGIDSESLLINVISIEATGKKEKVAGIEGQVYRLTWTRNNVTQQDELVLSNDIQAWNYTRAWMNIVETISNSSPSISIKGDELLSMISKDKLGILRFGNRFRLVSMQSKAVEAERFIAPDTNLTIPNLGDLLEKM